MAELPETRLQLTWERIKVPKDGWNWLCRYELILPLSPVDIRRGSRGKKECLRLKLGGTRVKKTDGQEPIWENGKLHTPFRDGAHIRWDALRLKLPMYVVYGDIVEELEQYLKPEDLPLQGSAK